MPFHKDFNYPWNDHINVQLALNKIEQAEAKWEKNYKQDILAATMPKLGDEVILNGMRRRPELNGVSAKVACRCPDEDGFMLLHLQRPDTQRISKMKVHNLRLEPLGKSHSSPALVAAGLGASIGVSLDENDSHVSMSTLAPSGVAARPKGSKSSGRPDRRLTASQLEQWLGM